MDVVRQSDINFLYPFINLADKPSFKRQMMKALHDYGFTKTEIDNASEKAFAELQHYKQDIRDKGEEVLNTMNVLSYLPADRIISTLKSITVFRI